MSKLLSVVLAASLALLSVHAEAKRLGGGRSIGQQSGQVTQRQAQAPQAPQQQAAPTQAAKPASAPAAQPAKRPWGAMLGGLAAGLGLAWLAHSLGLGEAFGNVLLIGLLVLAAFVLYRMFMARRASSSPAREGGLAYQGAGHSPQTATSIPNYNPAKLGNDASARPWEDHNTRFDPTPAAAGAATAGGSLIGSALSGSQNWGIPAGFDVDGFVTAAKRNFITLQEAWDRADLGTLRSMMTDGMHAEIRSQLQEREAQAQGQANKTEVIHLDATLLGIEEMADQYLASVEFNGMIREEMGAAPHPFREVWNMAKPKSGNSGWLVAGVQALQ